LKLIAAAEASHMLNIRLQRLYELVRQRAIPHVKIGSRQLRFDPDELTAWAKRGGVDPEGQVQRGGRDD
jgi:excisionase family DNA binding protein